jgi:hypothetical protein
MKNENEIINLKNNIIKINEIKMRNNKLIILHNFIYAILFFFIQDYI